MLAVPCMFRRIARVTAASLVEGTIMYVSSRPSFERIVYEGVSHNRWAISNNQSSRHRFNCVTRYRVVGMMRAEVAESFEAQAVWGISRKLVKALSATLPMASAPQCLRI